MDHQHSPDPYLAFFAAYRYYVHLRKDKADPISSSSGRLSIILGAIIGAFLGSRIIGILENPVDISAANLMDLYIILKQ